jgi:hypothetical protein
MTDDLREPTPDPAGKYSTPAELVADPALSLTEKRRLLDEWEDDIRQRLVASEEGMTGPGARVTLSNVLEAKAELPIDTPPRPHAPSKA